MNCVSRFTRGHEVIAKSRGFTLMELILTIVVLSVFASYFAFKYMGAGYYTAGFQARQFARQVHHIQILAMAWQARLRLDTSTSAYVVRCVDTTISCTTSLDTVSDPATQTAFNVNLRDGVYFSTFSNMDFDSMGRPVTSGGALITSTVSYDLTHGGKTWRVQILPLTGYTTVTQL